MCVFGLSFYCVSMPTTTTKINNKVLVIVLCIHRIYRILLCSVYMYFIHCCFLYVFFCFSPHVLFHRFEWERKSSSNSNCQNYAKQNLTDSSCLEACLVFIICNSAHEVCLCVCLWLKILMNIGMNTYGEREKKIGGAKEIIPIEPIFVHTHTSHIDIELVFARMFYLNETTSE